MNVNDLVAIDMHTHLEVSCRNPFDNYGEEYDRAADKYFRSRRRPTMDETIAYYREKKIGFVNFTVDAESQMGRRRIANEEIADAALANPRHHDRLRQHRPAQGQDRRARGAPADRAARRQGLQVPPHGAGLPAGRPHGLADLRGDQRIQAARRSSTAAIRASAAACAAAAGCGCRTATRCCWRTWPSPSPTCRSSSPTRRWPWQDEALSLAMHKPNIWIDLSGWSPKYFPPQLVQYANTLLSDRILFGSDFPLIHARPLDGRFRGGRLQGQGQARHPEGQCDAAAGLGAAGDGVVPAGLRRRLNVRRRTAGPTAPRPRRGCRVRSPATARLA